MQRQRSIPEAKPSRPAGKPRRRPGRRPQRAPSVTVGSFRDDPLYPRVADAVAAILAKGKVVAPVDVLVHMHLLAPKKLEDWRRGRVPYLERVIDCNLTRLSRLLRILRFHAHDLNLVPSVTAYLRWTKGPKHRLRFTKTGEPPLEQAYARHFVWPGKGPFHPPAPKRDRASGAPAPPPRRAVPESAVQAASDAEEPDSR